MTCYPKIGVTLRRKISQLRLKRSSEIQQNKILKKKKFSSKNLLRRLLLVKLKIHFPV
jgi:hypothetical protein